MTRETSVYPLKMRMPPDGNPSAVDMPLMAALVETSTDVILIDTGFPGQHDLFEHLSSLHIEPKEVTMVVNTHLHVDHTGNNRFFPRARILASKTDFEHARDFSHALLNAADPVRVLLNFFPHSNSRRVNKAAKHALQLAQNHWREDILGSSDAIEWIEDSPSLPSGISVVPTPGHTPGHVSVLVSGKSQQFIVAGDALPSKLFWKRRLQELTPRYNSEQFLRSKKKIESLHGIVMGGHDLPFRTSDMNYIDKKRIIL